MNTPVEILKQYWGYTAFRPLQEQIVESVLARQDTLALLPTGGGKSLCYQVPAMIVDGLCIVVSPLIALMQDQVSRLQDLGIPAASIHSGARYADVKQLLTDAVNDRYKLLYVSPERLQTRLFNDYAEEMTVGLIAVDEAHCISQWGHDFRPDYRRILSLREKHPQVPVLALTATATPLVQKDIQEQLLMQRASVFRQGFARTNIFMSVQYSENKPGDTEKLVGAGTSIIYCRSRRQTEVVANMLYARGVPAAAYHAGMTREKRDAAQAQWMNDEVRTMAATTAFGMGIDKADVRTVVHYDSPEHLEAYYQEAGRAGRDGKPSTATLLYNSSDIKRLSESTDIQYPPEAYLREVYQAVADYLQVPVTARPDRYFSFDLHEFCRRFELQPLRTVPALKLLEREGLWTLTDAVYTPATVRFTAERYVLDHLQQVNARLGYVVVGLLRMYSGIFHYPATIRMAAVARQLKITREQVEQSLEELAAMQVIEYWKPEDGPRLLFHHFRVDSRHLSIDMARIGRLRRMHEERTEAMIAFLRNDKECRERAVLQYFGEQPAEWCGHCDVCARRSQPPDAVAAILALLADGRPLTVDEVVSAMSAYDRAGVITALRQQADDGVLVLRNGVVSRLQKP